MYHRYGDISKFITDMEQLYIADDGYVYISKEEDYDIAVYLESCCGPLDEVKPFLVFLAAHIGELDNLVQRFHQKKRIKNSGRGYVCLPSSTGVLRFDYSQSMENDPDPQEKEFPFELEIICLEAPDRIVFDYWGTEENTQLEVAFEYKDHCFFLRRFGAFDCIPDGWEESE